MKIRTSYTGCPYITAGKVYDADYERGWISPFIINDRGDVTHVFIDGPCPHLERVGTWEVIEDDYEDDKQYDTAARVVAALVFIALVVLWWRSQ